ncbi:hypothetical protein [Photobacterium chitinilyticum]|uniref:Uncharacterized protein n=1 Tax=Photobacterium chitinilyticum TaxID=2485123 RepID=A0A3S3UFS9_9GAMM|nr:hypothetical protein [Photobacterium chitinilyticum]RWX52885.1 hypothetical protein EDI28_24805 [Photobacterium chitinilyticum]
MSSKAIDSAVAVTAITALVYGASAANVNSYLRELSLDADILAINFHQMLYRGFINNLGEFLLFLFYGSVLLFILSGAVIKLRAWLRISIRNKRKYIENINYAVKLFRSGGKTKIHKKDLIFTHIVQRSGLLFVVLLAVTSFLAWNEQDGKQKAIKKKENIANGHYLLVKPLLHKEKLIYLYCGSINCAGYNKTEGKVHYFPVKGISFEGDIYKKDVYLAVE